LLVSPPKRRCSLYVIYHTRLLTSPLPSNTDSASAAAHTPLAEEARRTPFEEVEARTLAAARQYHISPEQQHTCRRTRVDRSSSLRAARGGVPCDCVLHDGGGCGCQREKTSCGGDGCDCYARGSSEGANAGASVAANVMMVMKSTGVFFSNPGPLRL